MKSALDDEGSERYLFDQDFKPSINGGIENLISLINKAFAENKLSAEKLIDLINTKVWKANSYSRFAFNSTEVGHELWTVLAIYPKPIVNRKDFVVSSSTNNSVSVYMPNLSFIQSGKAAKRLTFEQWNENENNVFMAGNNILKGSLQEYAYLDAANYTSTTYTGSSDKPEWTIRPSVANGLVAMAYLRYPTPVSAIGDSIEFPKSLTDLIVNFALNKIAYKQGTQSLYVASAQDIATLVKAIN